MIKNQIIWNITSKCYYDCSFCCVSANNFQKELSFEEKISIIKNLDSKYIKIDVSGGDPLTDLQNFEIIKKLSNRFGKENISITSTGRGLERVNHKDFKEYVYEIGFTYDFSRDAFDRPERYNEHNLHIAKKLSKMGISMMAQTPLLATNISPEVIREIYTNLHSSGIEKILLMKFSDSGRGIMRKDLMISQKEIRKSINRYKRLERKYGFPKIKLTPSTRGNLVGKIFNSFNITPQGILVSNPWSYELNGGPRGQFVLGDLKKEKFSEIAGRNIYQCFYTQLKKNLK